MLICNKRKILRVNIYFFVVIFLSWVSCNYGTAPCQDNGRKSSFPYIAGDSFRAIADHVFDETDSSLRPEEIKNYDIIFVKTDYLEKFFQAIHPYIQVNYILITHNSDGGAPGKFQSFLNDEKIIAWFGQNSTISRHKKFIPIPIGIADRCWEHGNTDTFDNVIFTYKKNNERPYLLGINFAIGSNDVIRKPIFDLFSKLTFCRNISSQNHHTYLVNMARTKFIVSPHGNGLDCHRTWEAFLVGCIPIVQSSTLDELYTDLPIVIVQDWSEITEEFLMKKYQEIQNNWNLYNWSKLYFLYWQQLVMSYK